jgi:putative serine protease PepD
VSSTGTLPSWGQVAAAVEPSVVTVQLQNGEGSGVVFDTSGRIVTNNHVVADAGNGGIQVVLSDGRSYPASVVGTDPSTDLAVIKLTKMPSSGVKPATFGDSAAVKIGDPVMAVGNPLGLSDTVTTGIISALNRPVSAGRGGSQGCGGDQVVTNAIQTDAAINPGNSGGALVDAGGRVIGITSSIATLGSGGGGGQSGSIGLGFAIPVNEVKDVAQQLISTGTVQHAILGVSTSEQEQSVTVDGAARQAAVLQSVSPGSPAAKAGLQAGDAVIALNGQRVDSSLSLIGSIRALKPGTTVTLTVVHDGATKDVKVTLANRPAAGG